MNNRHQFHVDVLVSPNGNHILCMADTHTGMLGDNKVFVSASSSLAQHWQELSVVFWHMASSIFRFLRGSPSVTKYKRPHRHPVAGDVSFGCYSNPNRESAF